MNKHILEKGEFVLAAVPGLLNTGAGATSDYVSLKNYRRCAVIFVKAAGTGGDDPTLTFDQATAVAGTGTKVLAVTRIDKKQGTQTTTETFTKSTSASAASNDTFDTAAGTWTNSTLAESQGLIVADIKAEDLDIDGGFDCLRCSIADVGTNTQYGAILYYLHEPRQVTDPMPSAIID